EHSRFTHSLGVMHLMTRVMNRFGEKYAISSEARVVARVAAMLHDIGHWPFSHVMEKVLHQSHESWTVKIIADPDTQVHQLLVEFDSALPDKVVAAIENKYRPAFVCQLVSSQLDVDRFDYLLRDSLMTGAQYGNYDLEWLLQSLEVDLANDRVYLAANGLYAAEEYLRARYYMFRQVYFHRTLRSAETVLQCIMRRAVELATAGQIGFLLDGSVMQRVLTGQELSVEDYSLFDDHDVMFHIKQWARDHDPVLSDLATRFIERRLFKARDVDFPENERKSLVAEARTQIASLGYDPAYYLIEDRAADVPYYSYYRPEGKARLYIERRGTRELCDIADVSEVVRSMSGYAIHRICYPAEVGQVIEALWKGK
ncbi:MAG: HD domain-containing protein, partial [Blastocatellia bacterium]|nr:HD domain-containing protein [Blastocatellia bacterium]